MNSTQKILLPGGKEQFSHLKKTVDLTGKNVLVLGSNSEQIAKLFLIEGVNSCKIIIDDYDSMLNSRLQLDNPEIKVKFMGFEHTDFDNHSFDLVYSQGGISNPSRNKIVKEIKRILKPGGVFSVGEVVSLISHSPKFVSDIWDANNLLPLEKDEQEEFYSSRGFEVVSIKDVSHTLENYYRLSKLMLEEKIDGLSDKEKSYNKKLINRIKHESNVYLKLGGKKFMGFFSIILRKEL